MCLSACVCVHAPATLKLLPWRLLTLLIYLLQFPCLFEVSTKHRKCLFCTLTLPFWSPRFLLASGPAGLAPCPRTRSAPRPGCLAKPQDKQKAPELTLWTSTGAATSVAFGTLSAASRSVDAYRSHSLTCLKLTNSFKSCKRRTERMARYHLLL